MNGRIAIGRQRVLLLVLIGIVGLATFAILVLMLRGFVIALLAAAGVVAILAGIQYALWGHEFAQQPAVRQGEAVTAAARETAREAARAEELPIYLTDRECADLERLLERSLHEAHLGATEGPSPDYRKSAAHEETVLRGLLGKIRTFGA